MKLGKGNDRDGFWSLVFGLWLLLFAALRLCVKITSAILSAGVHAKTQSREEEKQRRPKPKTKDQKLKYRRTNRDGTVTL